MAAIPTTIEGSHIEGSQAIQREATQRVQDSLRPLRRPGRRLSAGLSARRGAEDRALLRRADDAHPGGNRLHAGRASGERLGRARAEGFPRGSRARADRDRGQGRAGVGLRARASGRRGGDLAAVLARLPDRREDRQGAESEAGDHGGHRLRPRRPPSRNRERNHGRRGHLLQLDQRLGARGDDDPGPGPKLHPLLPAGGRRRLEHRRLRLALLRPGGDAGRHRRGRAHRRGRPAAPEAVRGRAALHRPAPPPGGGGGGARRHPPRDRRVSGGGLRRRDHQRAPSPRDRAPLRRRR